MNSDLKKQAEELSEAFFKDERVIRYLKAKEAYEHDPYLCSLEKEIQDGKKNLKNIAFEVRPNEVKRLKKLQKEHDEDALYVTYAELKNEVEMMFQPIRDLFSKL